jgi:hypothetical protein
MIRGYFDPEARWVMPMLEVFPSIPLIANEWRAVPFLLDTGSTTSSVHPQDALARLLIDPPAGASRALAACR